MAGVVLTENELVASIKHSHLPTILVEGSTDSWVYRRLVQKLGSAKLSFFACGGRNTLLKVFARRGEFQERALLFVADRDLWLYKGIPADYQDPLLHWTLGYSIENDVYQGGRDFLAKLLKPEEEAKKEALLDSLVSWYAFEVERALEAGLEQADFGEMNLLNNSILLDTNLAESFLQKRGFVPAKEALRQAIAQDYAIQMRGKYIFQIFEKLFQARPKEDTRYQYKQLLELCFVTSLQNGETPLSQLKNRLLSHFKFI